MKDKTILMSKAKAISNKQKPDTRLVQWSNQTDEEGTGVMQKLLRDLPQSLVKDAAKQRNRR